MDNIKDKVGAILEELKEQIILSVDNGQFDNADFFMEQYTKLAPDSMDRFSLDALIYMKKEDLNGAKDILNEGLRIYPMSFDLLYNLGYVFQQMGESLEAYHIYMKAKYVADTEDERTDIIEAFKSLLNDFTGTTSVDNESATMIVNAGKLQISLTTKYEEMAKRKNLLNTIENHISEDSQEILEIGFKDGVISKNLNYYGYDVTAVDRIKERIISVIAREWHDNILQPEQDTARFYHEEVSLEWMDKIPEFDTIIAVDDNNLSTFNIQKQDKAKMLQRLINKAKKQVIIKVSADGEADFTVEDILDFTDSHNLELKRVDLMEEQSQLCIINREKNLKEFSIPKGIEILESRSTVFEVELNKCRDLYGAGYIDDFHHFVETLKEYEKDPNLKYENSILKEYYDRFQPKNLEEGLFSQKGKAQKLSKGWIGYPWDWDKSKMLIFSDRIEDTRPGGIHHFGPNNSNFGQEEFERVIDLYRLLKMHEYNPEYFTDGYISGYFLIKGEDYRFVITEGQHRVAALVALGYERIRCKLTQRPNFSQIVRFEYIKKWPQIENGVYSKSYGIKVFNRFFGDGVGKDRMKYK